MICLIFALTSLYILEQLVKKSICFCAISQKLLTLYLGDHDNKVKFTNFCILPLSAVENQLYLIDLFQILLDSSIIGGNVAVDTVQLVLAVLFLSEIFGILLINGLQ